MKANANEAGPTPGPWTLLADDGYRVNGREVYNRVVAGDRDVARVAGIAADKHGDANARLIAAAPDLLAALRALLPLAERGRASVLSESSDEERSGHADGFDATIEDARAAIAKARGVS